MRLPPTGPVYLTVEHNGLTYRMMLKDVSMNFEVDKPQEFYSPEIYIYPPEKPQRVVIEGKLIEGTEDTFMEVYVERRQA